MRARRWLPLGLAVLLGACASLAPTPEPSPTHLEARVAQHRHRAAVLEQSGDLRGALEAWEVALTIEPDDPAAKAGRTKLAAQIEQTVADRLRQGREALKRAAPFEARRQFLAVLALDPANREAFDALRTEAGAFRSITHIVRTGETLETIAQHYYGDRARSGVLAAANRLPETPKLAAGTALKIPALPGVPLLAPPAGSEAPKDAGGAGEAAPGGEAVEVNPLLADAREALETQEFDVALSDVDKLLGDSPGSAEGVELKKTILYRYGKSQLDAGRYVGSYRVLSDLAKLDPKYLDSAALREQIRGRLIQDLYQEGIRLYRDENLQGAIGKWRAVLEYDPTHAEARKNIEQAERLLRALQERQQEKQ